MVSMFDDHDLDERYQPDYDHSITYKRVLHVYDDHETVELGIVDHLRGFRFGLALFK